MSCTFNINAVTKHINSLSPVDFIYGICTDKPLMNKYLRKYICSTFLCANLYMTFVGTEMKIKRKKIQMKKVS